MKRGHSTKEIWFELSAPPHGRKKRPTGQTEAKTMEYQSNNNRNGNSTGASRSENATQKLIRENVNHLIQQLEAGKSDALTAYLTAMSRFHNYSFGNILQIARQKPTATHVAGMYVWNQLGRRVKRGEKGIQILAPMIGVKRRKDTDGEQETESKGSPILVGFRPVYIFDVSQTEGPDLPTILGVQGEVGEHRDRLVEFVNAQGIALEYNERIAPAMGVSYGGKIVLLPGQTKAEEFSTLVHELAHEMLHKAERRTVTTQTVRETEAEAIAFVVGKAVGLQNGTASADYIQLYHGNAALLAESLEVIQKTSAVILAAIATTDKDPQEPAAPIPQVESQLAVAS
jgi:antirestriction protein ArdC